MTHKEFIESIEKYYCEYSDFMREIIFDYIKKISEQRLEKLFWKIISNVKKEKGYVPCLATVKTYIREIQEITNTKQDPITDDERQKNIEILSKIMDTLTKKKKNS